jgi:hypothetical protein
MPGGPLGHALEGVVAAPHAQARHSLHARCLLLPWAAAPLGYGPPLQRPLPAPRHLVLSSRHGPDGNEEVVEWGEVATDEVGKEAVQAWINTEFAASASQQGMGNRSSGGGG